MSNDALAEDEWKLSNSLAVMVGQYENSLLMDKQHGISLHVSGNYLNEGGFRLGLQSTQINFNNIYEYSSSSQQNQENYLASFYINKVSKKLPGYWTLNLDVHQAHNSSSNSFSNVKAIAPQIKWRSNSKKIELDFSYAHSKYDNLKPIHQVGAGINYALNNNRNFIGARIYQIRNIEPMLASNADTLTSSEINFTHVFGYRSIRLPYALSFNFERGRKIFNIDMTKQVIYNLPMMQTGAETISAKWKIDQQTDVIFLTSRARYLYTPNGSIENNFILTTISAQLNTSW